MSFEGSAVPIGADRFRSCCEIAGHGFAASSSLAQIRKAEVGSQGNRWSGISVAGERGSPELIDAKLRTIKKPNHPAFGSKLGDPCTVWWHSRQSVIRLDSASSPRALRRLMW